MKKYDIIICGGGIAGCAAAIAAARRGMKCALIEKTVYPGGLATSGIVLVYLPLCNGKGKQVIYGLSEELLHLSNRYGPADVNPAWKEGKCRFEVYFSPASFVLSLDELLTESGVDIWYDTLLIGTSVEENRIRKIKVANKSGILELAADLFIDATGDCDVAAMAGCDCFTATNAMVTWAIEHREAEKSSRFTFGDHVSTLIMSSPIANSDTPPGINGRIVTDFLLEGRRRYRERLKEDYQSGTETCKTRYPLVLPSMVPLRHTRCIKGKFTLNDKMHEQDFPDSIGLIPEWRGVGPSWAVPYRTLLPENIRGLLTAGRCISSINDAWEVTRVIPSAALTGEVAGIAAALSLEQNILPDELPYDSLSNILRKSGFPLTFSELDKS